METWISTPEQLMETAAKEGFEMGEKEAGVILGYMEGHDYALGLDDAGNVIRNDLAYERGKDAWEEYSVREAILFACDMCTDLLENSDGPKEYMDSLRDDDETLTPLYEAAMQPRGEEKE